MRLGVSTVRVKYSFGFKPEDTHAGKESLDDQLMSGVGRERSCEGRTSPGQLHGDRTPAESRWNRCPFAHS
jgi:hypothetical protein